VRPEYWEKSLAGSKTIKEWFDSFDGGVPMNLASIIFQPAGAEGAIAKGTPGGRYL